MSNSWDPREVDRRIEADLQRKHVDWMRKLQDEMQRQRLAEVEAIVQPWESGEVEFETAVGVDGIGHHHTKVTEGDHISGFRVNRIKR